MAPEWHPSKEPDRALLLLECSIPSHGWRGRSDLIVMLLQQAIKETSAKRHLEGGCKKRGYKWWRGLCISGAVQKTRAAVTGSPPQLWLTGHRRRLYLKWDWITLTFHPLLKPIFEEGLDHSHFPFIIKTNY